MTECSAGNTISQIELADLLGLSTRSIRELAQRGHVKPAGKAMYAFRESIQAYTAHLRETAAARAGGAGGSTLAAERAREARERADNLALKNEALRGALLNAEAVEREWTDMLRGIRSRVLAVSSRARQGLPHLTPHDLDLLDREIREALAEASHDGADAR